MDGLGAELVAGAEVLARNRDVLAAEATRRALKQRWPSLPEEDAAYLEGVIETIDEQIRRMKKRYRIFRLIEKDRQETWVETMRTKKLFIFNSLIFVLIAVIHNFVSTSNAILIL